MGYSYVPLKMKTEVFRIKKACRATACIVDELKNKLVPGIKTREISDECKRLLKKYHSESGLLGYKGFPSVICISVNHVAAHGIPNDYRIKEGDILTLDLTAGMSGWYGDCAKTFAVGKISTEKEKLILAAEKATMEGIKAAEAGSRMGDIGAAIQHSAAKDGFTVLRNFVGHGIGREIHEEPSVLHCGEKGSGRPVVPGMVITIEPILTPGADAVETLSDGWSVITKDHMPCAQFEHTIAIFGDHTEILTSID